MKWGLGYLFWVKYEDRRKLKEWRTWFERGFGPHLTYEQRLSARRLPSQVLVEDSGPFSEFTKDQKRGVALALLGSSREKFRFMKSQYI